MVIRNGKCKICNRIQFDLNIHHIDGNRENNLRSNLIGLCKDCHISVHKGFPNKQSKRTRKFKSSRAYFRKIQKQTIYDKGYSPKNLVKDLIIKQKIQKYRNKFLKIKAKNKKI